MHTDDKEVERSQRPVVTIIIPCHNHADMIGDAILSVIEQDYRPIQITVIDDGSSDNPENKIAEIGEETEVPILVLRNESPTGPSTARNMGIGECWDNTDIFMMLDADDLYLQGKVSKPVEKYLEHPEITGIVYTDAIIENINTGTKVHEFRRAYDRSQLEQECIISNTPLISKQALANTNGYDDDMRTAEDWDLWLRITESLIATYQNPCTYIGLLAKMHPM